MRQVLTITSTISSYIQDNTYHDPSRTGAKQDQLSHQAQFDQEDPIAGLSNNSSSLPETPGSPIMTNEGHILHSKAAHIFFKKLNPEQRGVVGWHPQLEDMLAVDPDYIPTFNYEVATTWTSRDHANSVTGPDPPPILDFYDPVLIQLRNEFPGDLRDLAVRQMAAM